MHFRPLVVLVVLPVLIGAAWQLPLRADPLGTVAPNWISGQILSDLTLGTASPGPTYFVYGDLTIAAGVTLTIEPGVTLNVAAFSDFLASGDFLDRTEIIVNGTLIINGTTASPVTLCPAAVGNNNPGAWGGIRVPGGGAAQLAHALISGNKYALSVAGQASLANCELTYSELASLVTTGGLSVVGCSVSSTPLAIQAQTNSTVAVRSSYLSASNTGVDAFGGVLTIDSSTVNASVRAVRALNTDVNLTSSSMESAVDGVILYDYPSGATHSHGSISACRIQGQGGGTGIHLAPAVAITVTDPVTPVPCIVSDFQYGTWLEPGCSIRNVLLYNNTYGVWSRNSASSGGWSADLAMRFLTVANSTYGVYAPGSGTSLSESIVATSTASGIVLGSGGLVEYTDSWYGFPSFDIPASAHGPSLSSFDPAFNSVPGHDFRLSALSLFADYGPSGGQIGAYGPGPVGATPVQSASVVYSVFDGSKVSVRWYSPEAASGSRATVFRRQGGTEWAANAAIQSDGQGFLTFEDPDVVAGARYGYALGAISIGEIQLSGETWVDVPARGGFALLGTTVSPAQGNWRFACSLIAGERARLEVFDVSGRRVMEWVDVSPRSAAVEIVPAADLASKPGVYFAELRQGERVQRRRVVVLR